MKKSFAIMLCLIASVALIGCESKEKGTGFSKDEQAIKLLDDDTYMDVVIDGKRYALNDKFSTILENGWKLNEVSIQDLGIENWDGLNIQPMRIAEFVLENEDGRALIVTLINDSEEVIEMKDAKMVKMHISGGEDKKKGLIVLNGVTEGTSLSDLEERLDDLKIEYKSEESVVYFSESKPIKGELRFILYKDMVSGIILEDKAYDEYSFQIYKTPLEKEKKEQEFKKTAMMIEGVVDDLYESEVTFDNSSSTKLPAGEIAVATTPDGARFAITYNPMWSLYEDINLEAGDKVVIYYETKTSIKDVDGQDISRISADIMILNDSTIYSIFE